MHIGVHVMVVIAEIVFINLLLSSDNAVAIAAVLYGLPERIRKRALVYGTLLLIVLLIALTGIASRLMHFSGVEMAGGALMEYIALKLVLSDEQEADPKAKHDGSLWKAMLLVLLIDLVMSLDNVVAIAGIAQNQVLPMAIALAISIPIMVWGSQIICRLLTRFRILLWVGAGILSWTAASVFMRDTLMLHWFAANDLAKAAIGLGVALWSLLLAWVWQQFRARASRAAASNVSCPEEVQHLPGQNS
ncbi:YjbE family putative metal transport protein [Alicyclobacillus cycloheptanicus]|uniref:YjbE family integral membrane protein n=1 Tax=Alicyclobacillus cycloheptanicus TaxID=1457 RepID=A0ABT9XM83_9BACL|nr:YjbE family putative metal transport protein [Alicyclobacillus cycloheptanicus]MDQ0191426.1 YjbE family integral membrane protein [Alicyclobacillus cycloheptanicus]WDM02139.1 YjbE family putative metal transport protein [Alicyclobacillus cycloheptanicus]